VKQLAVISGKGGTGKTILSASFAVLASNKALADCDVDAANLHLLLHPDIQETHTFSGGREARLSQVRCTGCGLCQEACRFDAISQNIEGAEFRIDPLACEGCAVCHFVCPSGAIDMEDADTGEWYRSETAYGPFVFARLNIGAENSGKLVTKVREQALELGKQRGLGLIIIDGPPGIGCPVVAALSGVDLALVVTEPTPSGIQDMDRVIRAAQHFGIRAACCINKFDLNPSLTGEIEEWCGQQGVGVVGRIPYDVGVAEAITQGIPPVLFLQNGTAEAIRETWARTAGSLDKSDREEGGDGA
jgi:MinD superfamily P-loop ATPase